MKNYDTWKLDSPDYDTYEKADVVEYYNQNQEELEQSWAEYLGEGEFGSGEDKIKITDEMFWEFVEEKFQEEF